MAISPRVLMNRYYQSQCIKHYTTQKAIIYRPLSLLESILQCIVDKCNQKKSFTIFSLNEIFPLLYSIFIFCIVPIFYFNLYILDININDTSYFMLLSLGFLSCCTFHLLFIVGWNIYYKNKGNIFIFIKMLSEFYINKKNASRFYFKIILITTLLLIFIGTNMLGLNIILGYLGITKQSLFSYLWIRLSLLPFIVYINNIIISILIKLYTKETKPIDYSIYSENMFTCLTLFRLFTITSFISLSYGGILLYKLSINKSELNLDLYYSSPKIDILDLYKEDVIKKKWNFLKYVTEAIFGKSIWESSHNKISNFKNLAEKHNFPKIIVNKPNSIIESIKVNPFKSVPFVLKKLDNITYFAFKTEGNIAWFPLTKNKSDVSLKFDTYEVFISKKSVDLNKIKSFKLSCKTGKELSIYNRSEVLSNSKLKTLELPSKTGKELPIYKLKPLKLPLKIENNKLPSNLFHNNNIIEDLIKNVDKDLLIMSLHTLDVNMFNNDDSYIENIIDKEESLSENVSEIERLENEKKSIYDKVVKNKATQNNIDNYRNIVKLLNNTDNLFLDKLGSILEESKIKYLNNDYKNMQKFTTTSLDYIPDMFPIDINQHILQSEPNYMNSHDGDMIQVLDGRYAYSKQAVENFNTSVIISADWQCYHHYVCSAFLFNAYNNFVPNRVNLALIDYDKNDKDNRKQEDFVGKAAFGILTNYYTKEIQCTVSPESNNADAIVKITLVEESEDIFEQVELPDGSFTSNFRQDDAAICEFKTIQGLHFYATMLQGNTYITQSISIVNRHFFYLQKGCYVVFYENNVDYFEKHKVNVNLRCSELKNILGLYVTDKGVEVIPVKNSYFPQIKAYCLTDERDVFAVNLLCKYYTLNRHPPIRNYDYSVLESFPNPYTNLENNTIIKNKLYLNINGSLVPDTEDNYVMDNAINNAEKYLN